MTDSAGRQARPVPLQYRTGGHSQFYEAMMRALTQSPLKDPTGLHLGTRSAQDLTLALVDAWAAVGEIVEFYQDRIAAESYLATAVEPESVLALAALVGYRPRAGLAASAYLAYTLNADPADTAVILPAGMLAQSVPLPGQNPQIFETTMDLVARPGWNTLRARSTVPLTIPDDTAQNLTQLSFAGLSPLLRPNDVLLVKPLGADPEPVRVLRVVPDNVAGSTTVMLQGPTGVAQAPTQSDAVATGPSRREASLAAGTSPGPIATTKTQPVKEGDDDPLAHPADLTTALDLLRKPLFRGPASTHLTDKPITPIPGQLFSKDSDLVPRLMIALQPTLGTSLYPALGSTQIGDSPVEAVFAQRVKAAPFGVQVPPRPRFDQKGQPLPPEDWAVGGTESLSLQFEMDSSALHGETGGRWDLQQIDASLPTGSGTASVDRQGNVTPSSSFPGRLEAPTPSSKDRTWKITFTPTSGSPLTITLVWTDNDHLTVTDTDTAAFVTWAPRSSPSQRLALGSLMVGSEWTPALAARTGVQRLDVTVERPLPFPAEERAVLDLDASYDSIVAGSWVAILQAADSTGATRHPLVAQVESAESAAVNRYGMSLKVTRLHLDRDWIGDDAVFLSSLRNLTVYAQSERLSLLGNPISGDVSGQTIELATLVSGMNAGRRMVLSGTRSDLPGTSSVQAAESFVVSAVRQSPHSGAAGDTLHTVLDLAKPLKNSYLPASVVIYGNTVPGRQGATVREVLTAGGFDPQHPVFTIAASAGSSTSSTLAPVLSDPAPTAAGSTTSLTVAVDGRTWTPVDRFDDSTDPHSYQTGSDANGRTTVTFASALPRPDSDVVATYRTGHGGAGNVAAGQLSQLLSRPMSVLAVTNPLPATGGADPDGPEAVRANAALGLGPLGHVVSADDAAQIALSWSGIGKAGARLISDGLHLALTVTIAGPTPDAIPKGAPLCADVEAAIRAAGDPYVPVLVVPARVSLIVMKINVRHDPDMSWDVLEPRVRATLVETFGYARRGLGEDLIISDVIAVVHRVEGVQSVEVTDVGLLSEDASADDISTFEAALTRPPEKGRVEIQPTRLIRESEESEPTRDIGIEAAHIAYVSDRVPDTLILQEQRA